jgi:diaminohydroxyphosphoribosylaminopyrimidine deaminase / 5-amino-6-(5-phosphoribosylamino)uracil reductase
MASAEDRRWMDRALRLASRSLGATAPNPGVGCVLVRDGRVLGEGRHARCGDLHAETTALADARARGADPRGATAYVTLAPCTRTGRQPPCCAALVAAGIARVVAALADPVQDDPAAYLPGIRYEVGVGAETARSLHGGFLSRVLRGRPRITGKWAMSLDGAIAAHAGARTTISTPGALALARRRRRAYDAILVGAGTMRTDHPALTTPLPRRPDGPRRIVLGGPSPDGWTACDGRGDTPDPRDPQAVAGWLGKLGCNDVLVEGGAVVYPAWMPLYDRLEIWIAPLVIGGGVPALAGPAAERFIPAAPARLVDGTLWLRLDRA